MKRKDLKLGESYYVISSRDHDAYERYKHIVERRLVHLGPFSKDDFRHGFHWPTERDYTVTLEDGRDVGLPLGYFPTGWKGGTATHVLVENLSTGKFEAVSTTAIRLPWSEFVALRDVAVEKEKRLSLEREREMERSQKIESLIREKHPDVTFRYWPVNKNVSITLLELAKLAGVEVEEL